jgi:hypothetical protein
MKKLYILLEEVWVQGAFAEAGFDEIERTLEDQLPYQDSIHRHAV